MGYYDFDYFWTHQEVGGRNLKEFEKKQQLFTIENILKLIFGKTNDNAQNQTESSNKANNFVEASTRES